jgi:hypothetical protein
LYALSWFNSESTVILLDINGDTKWQYSTPEGDSTLNNMIKYKEIDEWTDMVVATSGNIYINYNKIMSSRTSPYPVSES